MTMQRHRDVGRFDEWAATYERHWLQRRFFGPMQGIALDLAGEQVRVPGAILDIGCGTGRLLRAAQQRFHSARLEGVDAAAGMVSHANSLLPQGSPVHIQQATAEDLPFPDHVFDLVFSTMTFHHWADQARGAAEIRRVLAPGGRWILVDFVASGVVGIVARVVSGGRFPRRAALEALLAGAGLRIVDQRPVPWTGGNVAVMAIAAQERESADLERAMGIEPT